MNDNYGIFGRTGSLGSLGGEVSVSASTSGGVSTSSSYSGEEKQVDVDVKHTHTDARETAPPPPPSPWAGLLSRLTGTPTSPARTIGLPGLYMTQVTKRPGTTTMPGTLPSGFKLPPRDMKIIGRTGGGLTSAQAGGGIDTSKMLLMAGVVAALGAGAYFLLRKK
jgi:hypothetical protein